MLQRERLTAQDFRWVSVAIDQAHRSQHRVRVGSVLVVGSSIHSGYNRIKNSPQISYQHATIHAEQSCIRKASRTKGGSIYVARLGAEGRLLPSFPCLRCFPEIRAAEIRRIVWWDGERWLRGKLPSVLSL